jgi:hypothetical protein
MAAWTAAAAVASLAAACADGNGADPKPSAHVAGNGGTSSATAGRPSSGGAAGRGGAPGRGGAAGSPSHETAGEAGAPSAGAQSGGESGGGGETSGGPGVGGESHHPEGGESAGGAASGEGGGSTAGTAALSGAAGTGAAGGGSGGSGTSGTGGVGGSSGAATSACVGITENTCGRPSGDELHGFAADAYCWKIQALENTDIWLDQRDQCPSDLPPDRSLRADRCLVLWGTTSPAGELDPQFWVDGFYVRSARVPCVTGITREQFEAVPGNSFCTCP